MRRFRDRQDAGRRLASDLTFLRDEAPVVVGLPRGGVPVADEVAAALGAPLDVIVVRKLGVPFQPELGMGAVGEGGVRVLNDDVVRLARVGPEELTKIEARERAEVDARALRFRGDRRRIELRGRTVIVVDDGIATGGTARAALQVARAAGASRVVLAVPVAPADSLEALRRDADMIVCPEQPSPFFGVGQWYDDFSQVPDADVIATLAAASRRTPGDRVPATTPAARDADPPALLRDDDVELRSGSLRLFGHLGVPPTPRGLVLFAHGSGSSRHSPRNRFVAGVLHAAGLATLLFDLLTPEEEIDRRNVFDVELLALRLAIATDWAAAQHPDLAIGYFGASTGAAAALWAAAELGNRIGAVVSRGGRPDLAAERLAAVAAPTLLIVGARDDVVLDLNRDAARRLRCEHRVEIVPRATHLFEEPGTLEQAAALASTWFTGHLSGERDPTPGR